MDDRDTYYGPDDWDRIAVCLRCEKPSCNNCWRDVPNPEGRKKKRVYRPRRKGVPNADKVKGQGQEV